MSLSGAENDFVQDTLQAFSDEPSICNDWEKKFLTDMSERYKKYGNRLYMSASQWEHFERIAEKHYDIRKPFD